jgi:hypothetical protein
MQQRQLRLGDILDDYCPRERRVTNHAVVAMVESDVKRTRCTTCDTEHEYKKARLPAPRKKKEAPAPPPATPGRLLAAEPAEAPTSPPVVALSPGEAEAGSPTADDVGPQDGGNDDGPVHRQLIRATLPRTEATAPIRQIPEFTIRQNGARPGRSRTGTLERQRSAGGGFGGGYGGYGGKARAGRPGGQGGRGGGGQASQHQRPPRHAHGVRSARPGKKGSR